MGQKPRKQFTAVTQDVMHSDWSHEMSAPELRTIVSKAACPTCKRRAGLPCININYFALAGEPGRRPQHNYNSTYYNYVHAARRKAAAL